MLIQKYWMPKVDFFNNLDDRQSLFCIGKAMHIFVATIFFASFGAPDERSVLGGLDDEFADFSGLGAQLKTFLLKNFCEA